MICSHIRQVPEHGGSDGLVDVRLDKALPCADPTCPATSIGGDLVMFSTGGPQHLYRREAGPLGWRSYQAGGCSFHCC